jgi:hypothetical protein
MRWFWTWLTRPWLPAWGYYAVMAGNAFAAGFGLAYHMAVSGVCLMAAALMAWCWLRFRADVQDTLALALITERTMADYRRATAAQLQ